MYGAHRHVHNIASRRLASDIDVPVHALHPWVQDALRYGYCGYKTVWENLERLRLINTGMSEFYHDKKYLKNKNSLKWIKNQLA